MAKEKRTVRVVDVTYWDEEGKARKVKVDWNDVPRWCQHTSKPVAWFPDPLRQGGFQVRHD